MLRSVALFLLCLPMALPQFAAADDKPAVKKPKEDYYELYKLLVDSMDQVERNYVREVDRRELIESAIRGVLSRLDPYSSYIPPSEIDRFRANVESEFGGIGIQVSMDDGELSIISPLVGTPAYRAGLLAGDRIVEINGKSTDGLTLDEAIERLKGPEGSTISLTVIHPGQSKQETVSLTRERIHIDTVLGDHRKADDRWDYLINSEQHIACVRLTAFSRDTGKQLRQVLEQLKSEGMRGLVLDLRFNPGGLLSAAVDVSGLFISSGRIVSTQGRNSPERVWNAHKDGSFEGFPMAVLVNRYSASASEIVAACLQDHGRAVIVGERTWGKGSVQNIIELEDGHSALKLTTAAYRRPSGKNIHRFEDAKQSDEWGVSPDKGYELKLPESETIALLQHRRRQDVVSRKEASDQAGQPSVGSDADAPGNGSPSNGESPKSSTTGGRAERGSRSSRRTPRDSAFVDQQLQLAVKYVTEQLSHSQARQP